jgi:hypothetical protein
MLVHSPLFPCEIWTRVKVVCGLVCGGLVVRECMRCVSDVEERE